MMLGEELISFAFMDAGCSGVVSDIHVGYGIMSILK